MARFLRRGGRPGSDSRFFTFIFGIGGLLVSTSPDCLSLSSMMLTGRSADVLLALLLRENFGVSYAARVGLGSVTLTLTRVVALFQSGLVLLVLASEDSRHAPLSVLPA